MASSCVVTVVPGRVVPGVCTRAVVEAAFSPHTVLGTSEARAHVTRSGVAPFRTRSECGLKQNEICELGMIVDTSQEKLTGPVDREPERLDLQRIASGFITGYEAH
jgi:hypothetical protein